MTLVVSTADIGRIKIPQRGSLYWGVLSFRSGAPGSTGQWIGAISSR